MWGYISRGVFIERLEKNEVGSTAMPHKVNPIDWENAEGNIGLANALFLHLAEKLPISRYQRDLSDSTALRSLGQGFGHSLIAYTSIFRGLRKVDVNDERCMQELISHPEVITEAVLGVLRMYGIPDGYDTLKKLTRGTTFDYFELRSFIEALDIPHDVKCKLMVLSPATYTGFSSQIARGQI